jgi:hypothetical protein
MCTQVAAGRKGEWSGHTAGPVPGAAGGLTQHVGVMKVKRVAHEGSIRSHHDERDNRMATSAAAASMNRERLANGASAAEAAQGASEGLASGRFREEGCFIAAVRGDRHEEEGFALRERGQHARIAAEVLDMNADDMDGMAVQHRRKRTVWDAQKKRYITLQPDEVVRAGKRVTLGGKGKPDAKKGQLYKQWVKNVGGKAAEGLGKDVKGGQAALAGRCGFAGCCLFRISAIKV